MNKNGFRALPVQRRIPKEDAVYLIKKAYEGGITFFDTARNYTDSEESWEPPLRGIRDKVFVATKTATKRLRRNSGEDLEISLKNLRTDHVDLYQFHNPSFCPKPGRWHWTV